MRRVQCKRCGGTGGEPNGGLKTCERCNGTGRTPGRRLFRSECPHCEGTGKVVAVRCSRCAGAGVCDEQEAIRVRVPPGVAAGQKLKVRKKGNIGRNQGEPGDLYVLVAVAEHTLFRRRGQDLLCEVPITLPEAALGADLEVPTLDGSTTIRLPPGTPGGKVFRLAGRGLPTHGGRPRGDLHIKVIVEVPSVLHADARAALQRLSTTLDDQAPGSQPLPRRPGRPPHPPIRFIWGLSPLHGLFSHLPSRPIPPRPAPPVPGPSCATSSLPFRFSPVLQNVSIRGLPGGCPGCLALMLSRAPTLAALATASRFPRPTPGHGERYHRPHGRHR